MAEQRASEKEQGSRDYAAKADSGERAERTGFDEKDASYGKHREKSDFERDFDVKDTIFTEDAKEKVQGKGTSKKAEKKVEKAVKRTEHAGKKAEKAAKRVERAKAKLPKEIDAADLAFSKLELELQKEINSVETDYPGYDEYRYNLDAVGHDPFALISYLSAVYTEFTAADVQGELESLFNEMYALDLNPTEETRIVTKTGTRTVTKTGARTVTDPETEEEYKYEDEEKYEYEEEEEYTVSILEVTLPVKDFSVVAAGRMDADQKEVYALYNETHGLLQRFYTPLDLYWYNYVSSYYGWRIHPATGADQLHRGMDIAVP